MSFFAAGTEKRRSDVLKTRDSSSMADSLLAFSEFSSQYFGILDTLQLREHAQVRRAYAGIRGTR
jgi:hypothetical protein